LPDSIEEKVPVSPSCSSIQPRLSLKGITKRFPGVVALDNASLEVMPGEIHAMVGENGAGKSTMMHIIAGVHQPDNGTMEIDSKIYTPEDEKAAQKAGVAIVYQEGSLFPPLSVAENIFAGRQPDKGFGSVDFRKMENLSNDLLKELEAEIDPTTPVNLLSPSQRQLVEIAKALSQQVRILILDEPTSSLTISEARHLFRVLHGLSERGVAIIYVTHRLAEVFEVADRVTVLKDGKVTGVRKIGETSPDELIQLEVGRELSFDPSANPPTGDSAVALEVEDLVVEPVVSHASLKVRAGEIVCLAGLVGAGRTELCEAIFGIHPHKSGHIRVNGVEINPQHPLDAMKCSIGMVPEDRRDDGLFLAMSISANIAAANLKTITHGGVINRQEMADLANQYSDSLRIATPSIEREVMYLSGGNQQKVLLARWLAHKTKILIVDEPTRGVDVGAKADIYRILRELADQGVALLVVSSDLPEVLALAHRIVVMSEGKTVGELNAREANEIAILQMATPKQVANERGKE
jgi:ABC-type sugar transport system ATPase subunit